MTDQDRARRFVQPSYLLPPEHPDLAALAAEFAAVRLEERAAVVAWLRRAGAGGLPGGVGGSLLRAADSIIRGAHHEESS